MKTRVISAIVAIALIAAAFYFFGARSLYVICSIGALGAIFEYSRLAFRRFDTPMHVRAAFIVIAAAIFFLTFLFEPFFPLAMTIVGSVFFITMVLMTIRSSEDLAITLQIQSMGVAGFVYCGLFAGFVVKLLDLPGGLFWLLGLAAVVFAGDTCAYLAGRAFGKRKLLEPVSPKKTIEGSIGGLVGSALAGAIMGLAAFPEQPLFGLILMALTTGAFAQVGDLFESLLKRVAEVKDSGAIMPGHGGFLDRIDGLLFAAPVYYVLARFLV